MKKPSLVFAAVLGLMLSLSCSSFAQDNDSINPLFKNWSSFKVGTSVSMKTVTKQNGKVLSTTITKLTLLKKSDTDIEIEQIAKSTVNGMQLPESKARFTYSKSLPDTNATKSDDKTKPKMEKGNETIKLGKESIKCEWVETTTDLQGSKTVTKSWSSEKIPGKTVKLNVKMSNGISTEMIVTKFDKK